MHCLKPPLEKELAADPLANITVPTNDGRLPLIRQPCIYVLSDDDDDDDDDSIGNPTTPKADDYDPMAFESEDD